MKNQYLVGKIQINTHCQILEYAKCFLTEEQINEHFLNGKSAGELYDICLGKHNELVDKKIKAR